MSSRYSDEAMAKKRVANRERFLKKSKAKFGDRFTFPNLQKQNFTYKIYITIGTYTKFLGKSRASTSATC